MTTTGYIFRSKVSAQYHTSHSFTPYDNRDSRGCTEVYRTFVQAIADLLYMLTHDTHEHCL
jgi:hypothetical protein